MRSALPTGPDLKAAPMRHAILALAFACLTPAHAQERTAYACIEQKATGFHPMENEKGFRNTNFQERRFTMIREGMRLEVKMDNDVTIYECRPPWRSKPQLLQCAEHFYFLIFDEGTLQFTRSALLGHLGGSGADSLVLSYGDCQRF
jgi:hypothetical protein